MRLIPVFAFSIAAVVLTGDLTPAAAQGDSGNCTWLPGHGYPGINGYIGASTIWDPGSGPPRLVVAGEFSVAGQTPVQNIAVWDGDVGAGGGGWTALGIGAAAIDGPIHAVIGLPGGDLIATGLFEKAGGQTVNNIARWNGSEWLPLGDGFNRQAFALAVLPSGDLVVGGTFTAAGASGGGGAPLDYIARWDGAAWSSLGTGVDDIVRAIAITPQGDLIAAGAFENAGGAPARGLARWDGNDWSEVGGGVDGQVLSLAVVPSNGDLIIGGSFNEVGGAGAPVTVSHLARWEWESGGGGGGGQWSDLGGGMWWPVQTVAVMHDESIVAGGDLHHGFLGRWDGNTWQSLLGGGQGGSMMAIYTLAVLPPSGSGPGQLIAAGDFPATLFTSGALPQTAESPLNIAHWEGAEWQFFHGGSDGALTALAPLHASGQGDVVAAGRFTLAGGERANHVAIFGAEGWSPLGTGLFLDFQHGARAVAHLSASDSIVVGGTFGRAGSALVNNIALWNGAAWSSLGGGVSAQGGGGGAVHALLALQGGSGDELLVAGSFSRAGTMDAQNIASWDGTAWSPLGTGLNGTVRALAVLPSGDVIAGGDFTQAGGVSANRIARWDAAAEAWLPLGDGIGGANSRVEALAIMPTGDILAGGTFTTSGGAPGNYLARWEVGGTAWSAFGPSPPESLNGTVHAISILENGDVVVAGRFTSPTQRITRWDGQHWHSFGDGMDDTVLALAALSPGAGDGAMLAVGGRFTTAGDQVSIAFARWGCEDEPCYPNCDGSTTQPILTVDDFTCFINAFAAAQSLPIPEQITHYANCDGSTTEPVLTVDDFTCFINAFAAGCP